MSELKWNWVYYPYLDAPNKQEESALKAGYIKVVDKSEVDAAIAELKQKLAEKESWVKMLGEGEATLSLELEKTKQKLESVQASMYADVVDANMENRRLKHALWLARAEIARTSAWVFWNRKDNYNYNKWKKVERKCRAKAEEYK